MTTPQRPWPLRLRRFLFAATSALAIGPLSTLAAASGAPGKAQAGYEAIPLGRGHLNRLCLAATVGGKKGLMILDCGASHTVLNEATYRFLLPGPGHPLPAGVPKSASVNGMAVPVVVAPDFIVGKTNLGAALVGLVPRHYLYQASPDDGYGGGRLYDGLLGENFLRRYHAIIDCGRLVLFFSTDPKKKLRFDSDFVKAGWTRVPMSDLGNNFTVPCTLHGHKFRLIVDTGTPFTNLDRNLLLTAQVESRDLPMRGGLIGMSASQTGFAKLSTLQIGDYTVNNIQMTTTAQSLAAFGGPHDKGSGGPIVGLFGGDALANNSAVIDIGDKVLYLKPAQGKAGHL